MIKQENSSFTCRETDGEFDAASFQKWSCSRCYEILFQNLLWERSEIAVSTEQNVSLGLFLTRDELTEFYEPDTSRKSHLCQILGDDAQCDKWAACCNAAAECCDKQQLSAADKSLDSFCKTTWDGLTCWQPAKSQSSAFQLCPWYFRDEDYVSPYAMRYCTENATWLLGNYGREFTDYRPCFEDGSISTMKRFIGVVLTTSTTCHATSVTALCISLIIFILCRNIRGVTTKLMVKLHSMLFCAFLGLHVCFLLFENGIYADSLVTGQDNMNTLGCRLLQIILWYLRSVTYWSLFCEVYYLRRRITVTTTLECESFKIYVLIALVAPIFPVLVAVAIRFSNQTESCWLPGQHNDIADYILHAPNLTVIALNLVILCHIQRTIMFAMSRVRQADAAISMAKRGIRIAVCLTPVYGIQGLFLAYRPEKWFWYDLIEALSVGSQGLIVSIFYAALNVEIKKEFAMILHRWRSRWDAIAVTSNFVLSTNANSHRRAKLVSQVSTDLRSDFQQTTLNNLISHS